MGNSLKGPFPKRDGSGRINRKRRTIRTMDRAISLGRDRVRLRPPQLAVPTENPRDPDANGSEARRPPTLGATRSVERAARSGEDLLDHRARDVGEAVV